MCGASRLYQTTDPPVVSLIFLDLTRLGNVFHIVFHHDLISLCPFLGAILMMLMLMQTAHGGGPTCPAPRSSFSTSCAIETTREPNYPAPWSHYLDTAVADTMELVPPNPEELFGELFQALLDRVDGHCQFELDSYSLLPERLVQSIVSSIVLVFVNRKLG